MLRRVLGWVGLAVVFLVVFFGCIALHRALGPRSVAMVGTLFGAAWVATKASRAVVDDFLGALGEIGMSLDMAARVMSMVVPQLSRQVNHVEQLSASRIADLGAEYPNFERAYAKRRLTRAGGCVVIEDARIAAILTAVEVRQVAL